VIVSADLGSLGARDSSPVTHTWEPPPPLNVAVAAAPGLKFVLALLLLLPLFLLGPNRSPQAWWLWLALALAANLVIVMLSLSSNRDPIFAQAVYSLTLGVGAVWLLMPWLESRYRILAFLKTLPVMSGFSLLAFAPHTFGERGGSIDLRLYVAIALGVLSLAVTLALALTGLCLRRRFGRIRLLLALALCLLLVWILILSPLFIGVMLDGPSGWTKYLLAILFAAAHTLVLLLPLVLLSLFQPFYRARFLAFLSAPLPPPTAAAGPPAPNCTGPARAPDLWAQSL